MTDLLLSIFLLHLLLLLPFLVKPSLGFFTWKTSASLVLLSLILFSLS